MKKVLVLASILSLFINLPSLVHINDLQCIFSEGPDKVLIEDNVVAGSIYFLSSKSYADLVLCEYEKSARQIFNASASLEYIEKAINELETAKSKYSEALSVGKRIGYNEKKVGWFKSFDYDGFIGYYKLNSTTAQRVKNYLDSGNVLGIYQKNIANIVGILDSLYFIRDQVKSGNKPDITVVWELLQQYSEATLFGNYATMMGTTILGNCGED